MGKKHAPETLIEGHKEMNLSFNHFLLPPSLACSMSPFPSPPTLSRLQGMTNRSVVIAVGHYRVKMVSAGYRHHGLLRTT